MRNNEDDARLSASAEQLVKLACQELGEMSARRRTEGFLALNARRSPAARRRRKRLALSFAAVVAALALILVFRRWPGFQPTKPLSYAIQGGRIDPSGALVATGIAEPTLRFSDGTTLKLLGGAHARLKDVQAHGARIALTGKVDVEVVHSQESRWLFDAGPFLIKVTGTAFTADWRNADGRLEVALRAGAITVTGPPTHEPIALRAGQRLIISTREQEVLIRDLNSTAAQPAVPRTPPDNVDESRSPPPPEGSALVQRPAPSPASAAPDTPSRATSNWPRELAAGHFSTIVQQAEQRGLEAALVELTSDDLATLSDAARYSRRDDIARRALVAQRTRFPKSARATDAAFLLGRLEEAGQRRELALGWYERYLDESPSGTYESEALGRKMTVVQRLYGVERARPIAEEYLRRFANGAYAAAARALVEAP